MELEKKIKRLLLDMGVNPKENGFNYLAAAIEIAMSLLADGVKRVYAMPLYEEISLYYETKENRVERCIRYSIEMAFDRRSAALVAMFEALEDKDSGKVTNSCFINTLAQHLLIQEN
jgi:hypothetical protein